MLRPRRTDPDRALGRAPVWPALAIVLLLPGLAAESLSGNIPLSTWIAAPWYVLGTIVAYGVPVLLIRETTLRYGLGRHGVLLLGFGYGVVNEGLIAKTLLASGPAPAAPFDIWGTARGLRLPWLAFICSWHAVLSVAVPLAVVSVVAPRVAARPLVPWRVTIVASALVFALFVVNFLAGDPPRGTVSLLGVLCGLIVACAAIARLARPADAPLRTDLVNRRAVHLCAPAGIAWLVLSFPLGAVAPSGFVGWMVTAAYAGTTFAGLRLTARKLTAEDDVVVTGSLLYGASGTLGAIPLDSTSPVDGVALHLLALSIVVAGQVWMRRSRRRTTRRGPTAVGHQ